MALSKWQRFLSALVHSAAMIKRQIVSILAIGLLAIVGAQATPLATASESAMNSADRNKSVVRSDSIPEGAMPRPADVTASALMRWLDAHPQAGAGGVSVDPSGETVTVAWKGAVPQKFRDLAGSQPTRVEFVKAAFSAAELIAEAERISKAYPRLVASIGPRDDYSGLIIEVAASAGPNAAREVARIPSFAPLTIGGTVNLVPVSRNADTSPFRGGALIRTDVNACSTGVSVSSGGTSGITTAAHCGGGTWRGFDNGVTLGTRWSGKISTVRDTQVIQTSSAPAAYIGAWNSTSSRAVYRAERPANNTRICSNGGVTGETCQAGGSGVYVRGTNKFITLSGNSVGPGFFIVAEGICGVATCGIIQGGDSGSPAQSYASTGNLIMKGLQVAADPAFSTSECKGHPYFVPYQPCYGRAFAVNTVDALSTLGVSIKVGG
jgi:hypothetical protein